MMEDNSSDSDQNSSSFPLFNFEALKHSFPEVSHGQLNHQPIQIERDALSKGSDAESSKTNKSSKPKKSKKNKEVQNQKITMKDILEDIQSGVPMEADLKMKEDRLQKMREGKQRKKLERERESESEQQASSNPSDPIEKALENINNMTSITNIPQTLFNISPGSSGGTFDPVGRIVIKDGKPVVELPESTRNPPFGRNNLVTLKSDKPKKLSSLSFRKNKHTKHWNSEETRKFYKGLEIFGSDFSMIAKLFADRDRLQIKNKLRKEEKQHPKKVEDAFKKHEVSNRKHILSHISDFTHKAIKKEPSSDLQILDSLPTFNFENSRNRSFSNCSLDSMDARIMDDLKGIISQEIQQNQFQPPLLDRKTLPLPGSETNNDITNSYSKPNRVNVPESKVFDDSLKENQIDSINIPADNVREQEPKKNNLLLNLLNK